VTASGIQRLNEAFRKSLSANLGRVVMTGGITRLEANTNNDI